MMSKLKNTLTRMRREESGLLSFEWVMLSSVLTFGIVSGISSARDAIIEEMGDVAQAMLALDQSYSIDFPLMVTTSVGTTSGSSDSSFRDAMKFEDGLRGGPEDEPQVLSQGGVEDGESRVGKVTILPGV